MFLFSLIVIVAVVIYILKGVIIVQQQETVIIQRFGQFNKVLNPGLHWIVPFIESPRPMLRLSKQKGLDGRTYSVLNYSSRIDLRETVYDFPRQNVITKDNVTMQIDSVVYYSVTDPKLYTYGIEHPMSAIENLTATTLRNIIGDLELDETLTSREVINTKMRQSLDQATDPWGIKVNRVELKNIMPPAAIQEAMEKQMKAERERREQILIAEGEKKSAILKAEGQKESAILEAEAEKAAAILKADAVKEKKIREADGEAQAILKVQQATAEGLKLIKEAGVDEKVIQLKSLEAFADAANGQATKIIVPSNIADLAGTVSALTEVAKK